MPSSRSDGPTTDPPSPQDPSATARVATTRIDLVADTCARAPASCWTLRADSIDRKGPMDAGLWQVLDPILGDLRRTGGPEFTVTTSDSVGDSEAYRRLLHLPVQRCRLGNCR